MFGKNRNLKQRLGQAEARIKELEAWKAAAEATREKETLLERELAGEIFTNLKETAGVSRDSFQVLGRMTAFEGSFQGAFRDLAGIDDQIAELDRNIATAGAAVDQTSSAIEQISASIVRISEESTARYQDIRNLAALSKAGQAEMASTTTVIQAITAGISDLRNFLDIIDDIAGKTSILSMNAAIQAAHAGQAGKGFAVVADEIRRLAESSAANAAAISKQLNGLIEGIHKASDSSVKTGRILAETEEKVAHAAVGFQEIEQGARELALGGREILEGVGSLREASSVMRTSSATIRESSAGITEKIDHLRSEVTLLEAGTQSIRKRAAELNGSGLVMTQSTIKQLKTTQESMGGGTALSPTTAAILELQHLAWVSRVRGVLDGVLTLDPKAVDNHHQCDLGKWLEGPGKTAEVDRSLYQTVMTKHESFHALAKEILVLHADARGGDAETRFPDLAERSEELVTLIRTLADGGASGFIAWGKTLEVGHPKVDAQHKRLVELINRLYEALRSGQGRQVLEGVLKELVDYTVTHFRDEEALFTKSDYPGKVAHLRQHSEFVETVGRFQADFVAGQVVMGSETMNFLKDWLVNHIQGTDRGFVKFLR